MTDTIDFVSSLDQHMDSPVTTNSVVTVDAPVVQAPVASPARSRGRPRVHPEGYRAARKEERAARRQKVRDVSVPAKEDETDEQIAKRLDKTFYTLSLMTDGIVKGTVKSLIVAGAAGCGKTFTVENKLEIAKSKNEITKYNFQKGSMTGISLYKELWHHREPGQVFVLDDCDAIFFDLAAMNVLKAALDTGKRKYVSWASETYLLEDIPTRFEFNGTIIFISNLDMYKEIDKDSRISPHLNALVSRSMFLDLQIHSKREIMVRLEQVVNTQKFMTEHSLEKVDVFLMLDWLKENIAKLRSLSIRTILQLTTLRQTSKDHWKEMAEIMLCKRS